MVEFVGSALGFGAAVCPGGGSGGAGASALAQTRCQRGLCP